LSAETARAAREERDRARSEAEIERLRAELAAEPRPLHPDDLRTLVAALARVPAAEDSGGPTG
jgi:hypothetical protein